MNKHSNGIITIDGGCLDIAGNNDAEILDLGSSGIVMVSSIDDTYSTEYLEAELRGLEEQLSAKQSRFRQVSAALQRRKSTKDEQPPQEPTAGAEDVVKVLTNKAIAMEAEQAKLVVEATIAREALREAEERLALVVRHNVVVPNDAIREMVAALGDVPPGGASGDAAAWIVRLHRAACEVAGMVVVDKTTPEAGR